MVINYREVFFTTGGSLKIDVPFTLGTFKSFFEYKGKSIMRCKDKVNDQNVTMFMNHEFDNYESVEQFFVRKNNNLIEEFSLEMKTEDSEQCSLYVVAYFPEEILYKQFRILECSAICKEFLLKPHALYKWDDKLLFLSFDTNNEEVMGKFTNQLSLNITPL